MISMNNSELKEQINKHHQEIIDELNITVDISSLSFENQAVPKSYKSRFNLKIATFVLTSIVIFSIIVFSLNLGAGTPPINSESVFAQNQEVFSFQSLAGVSVLSQNNAQTSTNTPTLLSNPTRLSSDERPLIINELPDLSQYLGFLESFLNQPEINLVFSDSDKEGFTYRMTYNLIGFNGDSVEFVLDYNEFSAAEISEELLFIDEIQLNSTILLGSAQINGETYQLEGITLIEDEEEKIQIYSYLDAFNYIRSEYEVDPLDGERKFIFSHVENGIPGIITKIEYEIEDGEAITELEFEDGEVEAKFTFNKLISESNTIIYAEYELETESVEEEGIIQIEIREDAITGESYYHFTVIEQDIEYEYETDRDKYESDTKNNAHKKTGLI